MATTLSLAIANDIVNAILRYYVRGKAIAQTIQEKPLLRFLTAGKKTFPGGDRYIEFKVQGQYLSDQTPVALPGITDVFNAQSPGVTPVINGSVALNNFFAGYSEDAALQFAQAANMLPAFYKWYECHAGLIITFTELKKDGITINDNQRKSEHGDMALTRIAGLLENRLDDFGESWARAVNGMLWNDGTQDANQIPGILALFPDNSGSGLTVGGLNDKTYPWWNPVLALDILPSAASQTLTKTLRSKQRQVRRFGGKPNKFLCGSGFLDALELEVHEKGLYTQEGFVNRGQMDVGIADISLRGVGQFEYDPTLDDMGRGNYCYEFDSRNLTLWVMEGEWNKVVTPERPYQYMVFLKSMTLTGALCVKQRNAHAIFSVTK
jgi:hypothetical protein